MEEGNGASGQRRHPKRDVGSGKGRSQIKNTKNNKINKKVKRESVETPEAALRGSFDVIRTVYRLFGLYPELTTKEEGVMKEKVVKEWNSMRGTALWDKYMKWKLAAFFAFWAGQDIPIKPKGMNASDKPNVLLGGKPDLWSRNYLRKHRVYTQSGGERPTDLQMVRGHQFLNSVLNSKKGMPRLSKQRLKTAEEETVKELSTLQPVPTPKVIGMGDWGELEEDDQVIHYVSRQSAIDQVRRTAREIFPQGLSLDRVLISLPSTSSNYNRTRSEGGTIGHILQHTELLSGLRTPGGPLKIVQRRTRVRDMSLEEHRDVRYEDFGPSVRVVDWDDSDNEGSPLFQSEYSMLNLGKEEWEGESVESERVREAEVDRPSVLVADDKALIESIAELHRRAQIYAYYEAPLAEPLGLAEPLKARVITKGPPVTYFAVKPIWKAMHGRMRKMKQFRLIGQPDDPLLMQEIIGAPTSKRSHFLSGDYKGATNKLDPRMSEAAAEVVADSFSLDEVERELFLRSLTGHMLTNEGEDVELKQMWGQLMGSITSFPILCIVNLAAVRWTLELHERRTIPLREVSAAINGDDVAARTTPGVGAIYAPVAAVFGLSLSVGKTFFSSDFFSINSRSYVVLNTPIPYEAQSTDGRTVERKQCFLKTKFLNMGLLNGIKRSGKEATVSDLDDTDGYSPASRSASLVEETPPRLLDEFYGMFLKQNKEGFRATLLPWFIPRWLGGLGLERVRDQDRSSELDLRIAKAIILQMNTGQKPVNLFRAKTPWHIRDLAERDLPPSTATISEEATGIEASLRLTNAAQMNLLFDSNIEFDSIYFEENSHRPIKAAVRINRKLWNPRTWKRLPKPIDERTINSFKTYDARAVVFTSDGDDTVRLALDRYRGSLSEREELLEQEIPYEIPELGLGVPSLRELASFFTRHPDASTYAVPDMFLNTDKDDYKYNDFRPTYDLGRTGMGFGKPVPPM